MFRLFFILFFLINSHSSHAQWANKDNRLPDVEIGSKTAPIEVIFYYSFSCTHCSAFHRESDKKLRQDYIDKGLVRLVLRDVALDEVSYFASTYAHMLPEQDYLTLYKNAMEKQKEWLTKKNAEEHFLTMARLSGLKIFPPKEINDNTKISDRVLARWQLAKKTYFLTGTPAFVINGRVYNYAMSWKEFEDKLKTGLKGKR